MRNLERGQKVLCTGSQGDVFTGEVAVVSSNGDAVGIQLDEPIAKRSYASGGMLIIGALMLTRKDGKYTDIMLQQQWDVTVQE